ncbi:MULTISPECIES: tripartite tricarboxylate transporter permease [Acutalibacteraceae]|uniref:tripartite tricarboxylate transporter permease n=1 Tax=Acutalibacteraceae TaxID=3082771 RepID=UPI0013E8DEE6|nr:MULTISPECIES: tripartite tricarboxylate transporter permease [Acutalibacteraceae]
MQNLVGLFQQFITLMDIRLLLTLLLSTFLGVIIGALPGLSATMGIALLTGLTYQFPISYTFAVLMGIYVGAIYGGSMSAILLNIPGTASAAATALEGHPLALQGKAETAIKVTRTASIIGTFVGVLVLALISPPMTQIALKFTSPEYFMLALFGVMICGSIVTDDIPLKGWLGGMLGLLIAMIGTDSMQGAPRFNFGNSDLLSGVSMVPAMIGFYSIPEIIKAFVPHKEEAEVSLARDTAQEKLNSLKVVIKHIRVVIQSSLIGVGIGALPGVGEDVAAWVSYNTAQRTSKHPEEYTHGSFEGIIAPEVGNNAAIGGALIPMLTLAVPGSPPAAVLLGALMIHNIRPGPMLMRDNPTFINYISALLFLSVLTLWIAGMFLAKPMSKILKVPKVYLMPIVGVLSIVGAYAINNRSFDILIVLIFGVFGYFLDKMRYSPAPIILGIILGNMIDSNFRRALTVSSGNPAVFFTRPIALLFFCIIVLTIAFQIRKKPDNSAAQ